MAEIIKLSTFSDERGALTVLEKKLPFEIKRIYYIYNATCKRGGHRHKKNAQALICLNGSCEVYTNNGREEKTFLLQMPDDCLLLMPEDWHTMDKFKKETVLLIVTSEYYDVNDYIDKEYS
ncbi:FdtA/QdtA family cupin domain-containing protein [Verrucomicrobiota bacterium]